MIGSPPATPTPQLSLSNSQSEVLSLCTNKKVLRPAAFKSTCSQVSSRAECTTTISTKNVTIWRMEPTRRRESVCRSLFGPVDHSQLRRDLKLKLKEIIEQDRRRWNFNFECETPLPGRFQWEEAARPKDAAHRSGGDRPSDGEDGAGTDQENCSNITNKHKSPTEEMLHRLSKPAASLKDNARITGTGKWVPLAFVCWLIDKCNAKILTNLALRFSDYFAKRRRTTTRAKSIPNHFHVGSNEAALRKTLRWTCSWKWLFVFMDLIPTTNYFILFYCMLVDFIYSFFFFSSFFVCFFRLHLLLEYLFYLWMLWMFFTGI